MNAGAWLAFGARRGPRHGIAIAGAATIAAIVGLAVYDAVDGYRLTADNALRDLDSQARVVAEQTARSVQAIDVVLRYLVRQHDAGAFEAMSRDELHQLLKGQAVGLVQAAGIVVMNPDGTVRAGSQVPPSAQPAHSVAGDPSFREMQALPDGELRIDHVTRSRADGARVFTISRRLTAPSGAFDGKVTALGRIEYFQDFYRDAFTEPGTRVSLLNRHSVLLARHPPAEAALGRRFAVVAEMAASATAGIATVRMKSPHDGVDSLGATRAVPDYPLIVLVGREADVVFARWQAQTLGSALRTLALATLAGLLLAATLRQLGRLDAARVSLVVSQERYALAAAGSDDGIWDWDLKAGIGYESARARELQGLPREPETQALAELERLPNYHPDDAAQRREAMCAHLDRKADAFEGEYRVLQPNGSLRWIRVRGLCIRDAAGRPVRIAGSVSDIDARKNAAIERGRLEQQLRQAQKLEAIGTLAGGIAHDFNNILAAILGYGELAQKGAAEGTAQRAHIDAALAAGARAKSLVERILAFSRSGMGERVPVHVQSVVAEALESIPATLPAGVRLERRLAAGDAGILGDPTQIHQVVMNLCANALQAMGPHGVLAVSADVLDLDAPLAVATSTLRAGRYLRLAVRDSGCGIEPRLLERIFDPFFTTKEVGVGTGLGLSLVHGIVTDLGGGIAVDSRVGEGSVFTVYLATQSYVAPPAAAPQHVPPGEGETVLFVDDEKALVRLGEETLAALGYEPAAFYSSAEALEAFRAEPERFDVVLSDEAMPGMTGSELAAAIRRLRPEIPIVLMSGFVNPALLARARDAGVAEVVTKPLAKREFARCLASALGRSLQAGVEELR